MQHVLGSVTERDVLELEPTLLGQVDRARPLGDRRTLVEELEQLLERGAGLLERVVQLAQLLDRLEQVVQVQHEGGHRAHGDDVGGHERAADADDDRDAGDTCELDDREVLRRDAHRLDVGVVLRLVRLLEATGERPLAGERLHDPHPRQALLQGGEVLSDAVADE